MKRLKIGIFNPSNLGFCNLSPKSMTVFFFHLSDFNRIFTVHPASVSPYYIQFQINPELQRFP